jgi:hypothetical protein
MCLAIFKPAGFNIDPDHLTNAAERNPDGAGLAYTDGNELVIEKGFFDGADTVIKVLESLKDFPALIHFRWSTQGGITENNCHPFLIGDWAMIHHGVIPCMPDHDKHSDTMLYAKKKMKRRVRGNTNWPLMRKAGKRMKKEIGSSKLAFLRTNGDSVIINEEAGEWVDGVWYSNDGYKEVVRYTSHWPHGYATPYFNHGYETYRPTHKNAPSYKYDASTNQHALIKADEGIGLNCDVCGLEITVKEEDDAHETTHGIACAVCWACIEYEAKDDGWQNVESFFDFTYAGKANNGSYEPYGHQSYDDDDLTRYCV